MAKTNGTWVGREIARWLTIIGALNWGLVGFFNWDLVRAIFGRGTATDASPGARVVYALVGIAGLVLAVLSPVRHERLAAGERYAEAGTRP